MSLQETPRGDEQRRAERIKALATEHRDRIPPGRYRWRVSLPGEPFPELTVEADSRERAIDIYNHLCGLRTCQPHSAEMIEPTTSPMEQPSQTERVALMEEKADEHRRSRRARRSKT